MSAITTSEPEAEGFPLEELQVQAWRREQLERLGVTRQTAELLGELVDWHDAAALVGRGCPPELAVEILR